MSNKSKIRKASSKRDQSNTTGLMAKSASQVAKFKQLTEFEKYTIISSISDIARENNCPCLGHVFAFAYGLAKTGSGPFDKGREIAIVREVYDVIKSVENEVPIHRHCAHHRRRRRVDLN
jgi:hypothetical protein